MSARGVVTALSYAILTALCTACSDREHAEVWTPVLAVADTGGARPTLAIDEVGGVAYVAYVGMRDGSNRVHVLRTDGDAEGEGTAAIIEDEAGPAAVHPQAPAQVAVGPDGTVFVAWIVQRRIEGRRFPSSDIRFARSQDGGRTFSPPIAVHDDPGFPTSHHFHNLTVAADGTVYVSWLDATERDRSMGERATRADAAQADASHHGHSHHGAEATSSDEALPGTELRVARSIDGGASFEAPFVVARGTCQCCRTALATDKAGGLYVAWRHLFSDDQRDIAVARSMDAGRSFTPPVRVHHDGWQIGGCPHTGPALAVDADGRVHVAWYTGAPGKTGVYHASSSDGGATFAPARALATNLPIAQVSACADGRAVRLAWEDPLARTVEVRRINRNGIAGIAQRMPGMMPALEARGATSAVAWRASDSLSVALFTQAGE